MIKQKEIGKYLIGAYKDVLFQYYLVATQHKLLSYVYNCTVEYLAEYEKCAKIFNLEKLLFYHIPTKSKQKVPCVIFGDADVLYLVNAIIKANPKLVGTKEWNKIVGILCNIPICCIEEYLGCNSDIVKMYENYNKLLRGKKDPYNINLNSTIDKETGEGEEAIVRKVIFHVPCSPECKETKKLYLKYKKARNKFNIFLQEHPELVPPIKQEDIDSIGKKERELIEKMKRAKLV